MGLDMYLYKEIYIGADYEHRKVKGSIDITTNGEKIDIPLNKVSSIDLKMGYWRKANHIHKWFVDNVQNGKDECQRSYVEESKLKNLRTICQTVLDDNKLASQLLPAQSGFFFGGTEYDDYYFEDIKRTIEIIDECLKDGGDFYYRSSW